MLLRRLLVAVCMMLAIGSVMAPIEGKKAERAYADMSDTLGTTTSIPIRGRLLEEKPPLDLAAEIPRAGMRQNELKRARVTFLLLTNAGERVELGSTQSDHEGYVDTTFTAEAGRLEPGRYVIEARHESRPIGRLRAHLLAEDDTGLVIRSDVDMTYLNTDFESSKAKLKLLKQDARARDALPGMAAVYRALYQGAGGDADRPLVFISGSPRFFKRTIEAKLDLDGIVHDGVVLKPFKTIAYKAKHKPWKIKTKLEEQVGYKMHALLRGRLEMPPGVSEILMGDDTEADYAIYALYHRFLSREMSAEALRARLVEFEIGSFWLDRIDPLLGSVLAHVKAEKPVRTIYINRTPRANTHDPVENWAIPGVTLYHSGAAPLVADLVAKGLVPETPEVVAGTEPEAGEIVVEYADCMGDSKLEDDVELAIGARLRVALCSNPTTGHKWGKPKIANATVLTRRTEEFVGPKKKIAGAPGRHIWTFEAIEAGATAVLFEYRQPWLEEEPATRTLTLNVSVSASSADNP